MAPRDSERREIDLKLSTYQARAKLTDNMERIAPHAWMTIPFLGLVGEAGELLTEYKKALRDPHYKLERHRVAEELGDALWYLATIANRYDLSLESIARENLTKLKARYQRTKQLPLLGDGVDEEERFPARLTLEFRPLRAKNGQARVGIFNGTKRVGDRLTDNAYYDDGYRFHDVFHLGHAVFLRWSPVTRKLLGLKRKSVAVTDEVEDGGRAAVLEEAIVATTYAHALDSGYFEHRAEVDYALLKMIKHLTRHLEVRDRTPADWEHAIMKSYDVWRALRRAGRGRVHLDFERQSMRFEAPKEGRGSSRAVRR